LDRELNLGEHFPEYIEGLKPRRARSSLEGGYSNASFSKYYGSLTARQPKWRHGRNIYARITTEHGTHRLFLAIFDPCFVLKGPG
jgi:hypothetical protein